MLRLKRDLGLFETTLMGIGIILGAGIYVLIGAAAGLAGNAVWMSFGLASLVAIFTGMSYAEFTSGRTNDSAEYDFVKRSLNEKLGFMTGWLIILMGIISAAAVALGFAGYFSSLVPTWAISKVIIAILLIAIFSLISYYGIKEAAQFYFQTSPSLLNINQSIQLAVILPGPNIYSSFIKEASLSSYGHCRFSFVLWQLLKQNYISLTFVF